MKGAIFLIFEQFVTENFGAELYEEVLDSTDLEAGGIYVGPETYAADDLIQLVGAVVEKVDISLDEALRGMGRFAFAHLANSVPMFMEGFDHPRPWLLTLESVIHTEIRKLDPEANPARFTVIENGSDRLMMTYESDLGLFGLVHGLLDGVGDWFGVPFEHELVSSEGTNGTFELVFQPVMASVPAGAGATDGA